MLINHCPACRRVNADDAVSCSMCGADLDAADTVRLPLEPRDRRASGGALWLDDLVGPSNGASPPDGPQTQALALTLGDVGSPPPPEPPQGANLPRVSDLVQSDGATQAAPLDSAADSSARHSADASQRAERRAAVRRDRRIVQAAAPRAASGTSEVLVVGDPSIAREQLCGLLRSFGFAVHSTSDATDARACSASPSLVASFVLAEFSDGDGGNGIDLCGQLRHAHARGGDRAALLVLVAAQLQPTDRVRAELAGCDDTLLTPITRGPVARVLDGRGIRLPSDPRRA